MIRFCDGVLDLARPLPGAMEEGRTPTEADRQTLREGIARWQTQVEGAAAGERTDNRVAQPAAAVGACR